MPYADIEQQREYQRAWRDARRREFFVDKACAHCGSVDELELHHVDPAIKVSHKIWTWSAERRAAEIAKCIVLCNSCHQAETFARLREQAEERFPCGTAPAYRRGCRCSDCREANRLRVRANRQRARAS
jgi:hypothetical protein